MMLAFEFHPEVQAEFFAGADWFEERRGRSRCYWRESVTST
jgi:hypothetical protein